MESRKNPFKECSSREDAELQDAKATDANVSDANNDNDAISEEEEYEELAFNQSGVITTDTNQKSGDAHIASDIKVASPNLASQNFENLEKNQEILPPNQEVIESKIQTLEGVIMDLKLDLWKEMSAKSDLINKCYTLEKLWKNSISADSNIFISRLKTTDVIKSDIVYEAMMSIDLSLFHDTTLESYQQFAQTLESIAPYVSSSAPSKILVLINGYSGAMIAYLSLLATKMYTAPPGGCVIAKPTRDDSLSLKQHYSYLIDCGAIKTNVFGSNYILSKGYQKMAPYDVIIIPEIGWAETSLASQLKFGGLFINPFENNSKLVKQTNGTLLQV